MSLHTEEILSASEIVELKELREYLRRKQPLPSYFGRTDSEKDLERYLRVVDKLIKALTNK